MAILSGVSFLAVGAARHEDLIAPNTRVGIVDVGGLTREEAAKKLRIWWETDRRTPITLADPRLTGTMPSMSASQWGLRLDDRASVAALPLEPFVETLQRQVGLAEDQPRRFAPVWLLDLTAIENVKAAVRKLAPPNRPARAFFRNGQIVRRSEIAGLALKEEELLDALHAARETGGTGRLPLSVDRQRVPDAEIEKIVDIVGEFSTRFPTRQHSRNNNIRLAAAKIDGTVLMPGETFGFNAVVGRRRPEEGYKLAGVYRNGRHEEDIGGGICQVSTTLYNTALLANLKIVQRQNHSLPVAYVPSGRDATVSYGSLDLRFQNSMDHPIAISSQYETGKLTFRVLGQKEPGLQVRIEAAGLKSWSRGIQYVDDPSLPPGKQKVVDKGGSGRSVTTYRVVLKDGRVVRREHLGQSVYRGGPKIVAINRRTAPAAAEAPSPPPAPASPSPDPPE